MSLVNAIALGEQFGLRAGRKRANCPCCGYKAALAILPGRGGRPPSLWCANGCRLNDLARYAGIPIQYPDPRQASDADARVAAKRERAAALWAGSEPVPGTLAETYLHRRGLPNLAHCAALRYRPDCPHPEGGRLPALVASVTDADGNFLGVHRTFLARDGRKAKAEPAKASLGPCWNGAIRLDPLAPELVIGEGIESSASAGVLLKLPVWAAVSAGNLEHRLVLPSEVGRVVIAVDRDDAGERAAERAAARWRTEGRAVEFAAPNRLGTDFNDVLLRRVRA